MENKKLVKEIITTETEKFTEEGKIKERVKETREKIYSNAHSKKEMDKAKVVEKDKSAKKEKVEEKVEEKPEPTKEELIKSVAEGIDSRNKKEVEKVEPVQTPVPLNPMATNSYQAYLEATKASTAQATKFPWETN